LQQQEHYDFTQWNAEHGISGNEFEKDVHALLLVEPPHVAIGAAGFAWLTDWVDLWRLISAYKNKMRAICPRAIYES
jgi:hypothetical protein